MYAVAAGEHAAARDWLEHHGILTQAAAAAESWRKGEEPSIDSMFDRVAARFLEAWEDDSRLRTFGDAVEEVIEFRKSEGEQVETSVDEWQRFAGRASLHAARQKARELGVDVEWDCEAAKTPEGYYQVRGIPYAIAKSLAAAPFADLLWMETKTADLGDACQFAEAIHAEFPDKMLAYTLSPSFSWDTTGMSDEEMRRFPEELGKLGFVFNFITYGGHQIDGLAAEEFGAALKQEGMLALARLQRKLPMFESPYRAPQTLVGGPRADAALTATSGRTATTMAIGKGSTQHHLVQTEVPKKLLEDWLGLWTRHNELPGRLHVQLRPHLAGSELLELGVYDEGGEKLANVVFTPIHDRRGRSILSVRDQNTFAESLRRERLMTWSTSSWCIASRPNRCTTSRLTRTTCTR